MPDPFDPYFEEDPTGWLTGLPPFEQELIAELTKRGATFEEVAGKWLTATAANTYCLGAEKTTEAKESLLAKVKAEVRGFICGDKKYQKEREGLFGAKGPTRPVLVSSITVAIAPHVGLAAAILAPIVALTLASLGKIAVNAWCGSSQAGK